MKISENGIELIKHWEGFKNHPYLCPANVPTIGYGSTYYPDGTAVKMTDKPITIKEGVELLKLTVKGYEMGVDKAVTSTINQNQFDALVSFTYNLGVGAFKSSTLLKKINKNPLDETIKYEFSRWNKSNGKPMKGLTRRRNSEAYLYFLPM